MKFEDLYYEEVTQASFQEMVEICRWLNEIYGHHPVIIGGWAVFLHHPGMGSRDIDILFPERRLKDSLVNTYLLTHGYRSEGVFGKEYFKEVETSKGKERIIIDACSVEDVNRMSGADVVLPWSLAFEYRTGKIVEGFELFVPVVEVLLMYKAKAALDREHNLGRSFDPFYFQQKIVKDEHDIRNLIENCAIDHGLLGKLLDESGFRVHFSGLCEKMELGIEFTSKL